MAKIDVDKVELVWPGKYKDDGTLREAPRVSLPFQVIERVNESRASHEAKSQDRQLGLFDVWEGDQGDTFEEGWRNKLIWGDNLLVMGSLLGRFAGKVDLVYIDPPFATGADFSFTAEIGNAGEEVRKEQSVIEEKAYRDTWGAGRASFLQMLGQRIYLMKNLLSAKGSIYIHLDYRVGPYVKVILDELLGEANFRNEVVWYYSGGGASKEQWARKHDNIYFYSAGREWTFNVDEVRQDYKWVSGQKRADGSERDLERGKLPDDVFDLHGIMPWATEKTGYETQKPESLLERIIKASSNKGDLVADFFCGSGTSMAVAEKLGRRWIGCDLGRYAIHTSRKRLLDIEDCKPFEILNLGKYERQYWQGMTFVESGQEQQKTLYEYLAFILRLYDAQPISGMEHIHGKKGKAFVHIGPVDSPVTIDEVGDSLEECVALEQKELHILGWEWEMGLNDLMVEEAKKHAVKLILLQIPREVMEAQAAEKGDIQFFELAYLDIQIDVPKKLSAQVSLKDFVIPNTELIPEEVRQKVKKWSDYIDYWAVDWDFQEDTFIQGWVAYRTRKDRKLALKSNVHAYDEAGNYSVVVKVIDIFGNDTTQAFQVEVK